MLGGGCSAAAATAAGQRLPFSCMQGSRQLCCTGLAVSAMELDQIAAIGEAREQLPHYKAALDAVAASGNPSECRRFVDHGEKRAG